MLQKNAIVKVPSDTPGFYSKVFLTCKVSGGWHPVFDLKQLNAHLNTPHFRMFYIASVLSRIKSGDFAFKTSRGHILSCSDPDRKKYRQKYLHFAYMNNLYQFRVLPFSLNTAPQVLTRLGHTVSGYLHRADLPRQPVSSKWCDRAQKQCRPLPASSEEGELHSAVFCQVTGLHLMCQIFMNDLLTEPGKQRSRGIR